MLAWIVIIAAPAWFRTEILAFIKKWKLFFPLRPEHLYFVSSVESYLSYVQFSSALVSKRSYTEKKRNQWALEIRCKYTCIHEYRFAGTVHDIFYRFEKLNVRFPRIVSYMLKLKIVTEECENCTPWGRADDSLNSLINGRHYPNHNISGEDWKYWRKK